MEAQDCPFADPRATQAALDTTGGLTLSQLEHICTASGAAIQNWVKRGWVARPDGKRYDARQVWRVLIIDALRGCLRLEDIALLLGRLNGQVEDEADDIISEGRLYSMLCGLLTRLEAGETSPEAADALAKEFVRESGVSGEDRRGILENTLSVMACAALSARYRAAACARLSDGENK